MRGPPVSLRDVRPRGNEPILPASARLRKRLRRSIVSAVLKQVMRSRSKFDGQIGVPTQRSTAWWLETLKKREGRMGEEKLHHDVKLTFDSPEEREACVRFFNAAYRAEESGLAQAHALASRVDEWDPELAACLRLYGNEEGWHRSLLTEFLAELGADVRPMSGLTRTMYASYGSAKDMATIVLTNLMFETIGATTYRMALRTVKAPLARQMLTILTRDEAFHVPLNVHFLRAVLARTEATSAGGRLHRAKLQAIYNGVFVGLLLSAHRSRKAAKAFDHIPFVELARAYVENLARLFVNEPDLRFEPPRALLAAFGLRRAALVEAGGFSPTSGDAAELAADRERVAVTAL